MTINPVTQAMRLMLDRGVFANLPSPSNELLRLLARQKTSRIAQGQNRQRSAAARRKSSGLCPLEKLHWRGVRSKHNGKQITYEHL
jgi:hypothetical protein